MKVAIASTGRFHVLDLARELDGLGVEILFYSYVPAKRAARFGLPRRCQRGVMPLIAPLVALQRYADGVLPALQEKAMAHALDAAVSARLAPCDIFICMSGMYLDAARYAKRRYGAQIWVERGSRHILSQRAILSRLEGAHLPSDFIVARELAGYDLADRIVVPSKHVAESFEEQNPELAPKLFVNPYGVDLDLFPERRASPARPRTVLFVGSWCRRKGVDVLVDAVRKLNDVTLLHVGGIADAAFPSEDRRFQHVEPVPQWQLTDFYAGAHVFALASREDGFGLVLSQALASGLALVCTTRTGGSDLAALSPVLSDRIYVTEPDDAAAFAHALDLALGQAASPRSLSPIPDADRDLLSWASYGRRYRDELQRNQHRQAFAAA